MLVYAVTIFLSAFLLFQVQPMIAKFILPWFGGSAAVWSAALLFFQLLLLAGYFYAHLSIRYLKARQQLWLHAGLLAIAAITLPIIPAARWKPVAGGDPTLQILILLTATVGLPYGLLASTSPLLQAWYVRTHTGAIPYRLFALSNFGSMLALLSYPFFVEPRMTLGAQAHMWSWAFGAFAIVCFLAGWKSSGPEIVAASASNATKETVENVPAPPAAGTIVLWIALAACASTLLLATTSHLTQNVAPIPLLWVVPLSLYLLSFILCFESDRIYQRWLFLPFGAASLALFAYAQDRFENNDIFHLLWGYVPAGLIPALCFALFMCCMVCHGELAHRKPHPRYLTQYFLMVSVGGAIGGVFVALIAPRIFHTYLEMPIATAACGLLIVCVLWDEATWQPFFTRTAMIAAAVAFAVWLGRTEINNNKGYLLSARNFYGVLHVRDDPPEGGSPATRILIHGTIDHGSELLIPEGGRTATSYFVSTSGINRAIRTRHEKGPMHIGILGLGAGVTASMANAGDTLHYYEINQLVFDIERAKFRFFNECPADKHLYLGDGRLVLDALPSEQLDFLAMDAFTSDSVPMHLLTTEAYKIYLKHLKPDGLLTINISNRYLDLEPVVAQAAKEIGWSGVVVADEGDEEPYASANTWIVLSADPAFFNHPNFQDASVTPLRTRAGFHGWTDDYSSIAKIATGLPDWLKRAIP
jgi:spermidine synthase